MRDSLGACQQPHTYTIYLKPVDGHAVFAVCVLVIVLCIGWLIANHKLGPSSSAD